jgi:site-specific DNA recombinase
MSYFYPRKEDLMPVALYARVSTGRQEREQTIASQLSALRQWAHDHSHDLRPEHIYCDEGYSGARLDRPALERLRDAAQDGTIALVAVWSPDRLARKYAYQVILLEEFRRVGCEVVFLQHPLSDDPNDQLLLQIQGAMAEYERALLQERFRRGRLQKIRAGYYLSSKPPYGYRYIPKRDGVPGYLVIEEHEAEIVRTVYHWVVDEQLTVRQLVKRLNHSGWRPRSGKAHWTTSTLHGLLANPIYTGTAYFNRYSYRPPRKPRRPQSPRATEASCRTLRPREEWIGVSVPALIEEETYQRAQTQLARNSQLSFRHNQRHSYLLRCLLRCGLCGLNMFGRTYSATTTLPALRYYNCKGKDLIGSGRTQPCPQRTIKAEELEAVIWTHIVELLSHPTQLLAQFEQFATLGTEPDAQAQADLHRLEAHEQRLAREETRLLDAYQTGLLSLAELGPRRQLLTQRRHVLHEQREQHQRLRQQGLHAQAVLSDLTQFCNRIRRRLPAVTLAEQQALLQLLIDRSVVGTDTVEIQHVIPLHTNPTPVVESVTGTKTAIRRLRSDGTSGS